MRGEAALRLIRDVLRRLEARGIAPGRVSEPVFSGNGNASLQALTVAALALPGLSPVHAAEGDEGGVQYGHYQEGGGTHSRFRETGKTIGVDTLQGYFSTRLMDRVRVLFNYTQDTWSGATPIAASPAGALRRIGNIVGASRFWEIPSPVSSYDPTRGVAVYTRRGRPVVIDETVEIMAYASPETRRQGDFRLAYEWDEAAVEGGGGVSIENDYDVWFVNLGGRMDFNQKTTTVTLGGSYTNSAIDAQRFPYSAVASKAPDPESIHENRQDGSFGLGVVQILDKKSVLEANAGFTSSTGYLSNPYKQSIFFATLDAPQLKSPNPETGYYSSLAVAEFDNRPTVRDQVTFNTRYVRYFDSVNGALHADYRFYHDGWGINAHTFEAAWGQPIGSSGWTLRPRVRYYTQGAAHFYSPYYVLNQTVSYQQYLDVVFDGDTSSLLLPKNWSSDYRLSGYGALSGGITFSKQFARGVLFQAGAEYYTHSGAMKLGGGGEADFANFNFYLLNAALKVDLSAQAKRTDTEFDDMPAGAGHEGHHHHEEQAHHHAGSPFPAGVMFAHMMHRPDDFMVGYRYMWSAQSGNFLHGTHPVGDADIVANGCGGDITCSIAPREMNMHMHMLDVMYAPTDWLNLMIMPMFMDMNMSFRALDGADENGGGGHGGHSGHANHLSRTMASGGWGDTGFYGLVKLFDIPQHHMHLTLGFTAPTGDTTQRIAGGDYTHYMMQLGSGTWDFRPSLTYTGYQDSFSWGAQFSGITRGDDQNEEGYRLGDQIQTTAWGSYQIMDWLSANVRGMYTEQYRITGYYNGPFTIVGPMDVPTNYGGRFWDVGFGLNADVKSGELKGNSLSIEWLEPVATSVNGYQLKPQGMLSATWTFMF